ncbi:MAG: hypothetical protein PHN58_06565, partial [Candidatus Cloacimonetes bacterium]|nr:hypothetical protein [Candidatus Cloacimonadota bacterium]
WRKIHFLTKLRNEYLGHLHNIYIYTTVCYNLSTSLFCGNAFKTKFDTVSDSEFCLTAQPC